MLITGEADGPSVRDKDQGACVTYKTARKRGVGPKRKDGFPEAGGDKVKGAGRLRMALIVVRGCEMGVIGVIVCIAWRPKACAGILREEIEVRLSRNAVRLANRPILRFQRKPRRRPGRRGIRTVRPRVNVGNRFRPNRMRRDCS